MTETYLDCDHVVGRSLNVLLGSEVRKRIEMIVRTGTITSGDQFQRIRSDVTQVKKYVAFFLPSKRMLSQF